MTRSTLSGWPVQASCRTGLHCFVVVSSSLCLGVNYDSEISRLKSVVNVLELFIRFILHKGDLLYHEDRICDSTACIPESTKLVPPCCLFSSRYKGLAPRYLLLSKHIESWTGQVITKKTKKKLNPKQCTERLIQSGKRGSLNIHNLHHFRERQTGRQKVKILLKGQRINVKLKRKKK